MNDPNAYGHLIGGERRQLGAKATEKLGAPPVAYISIRGPAGVGQFTLFDTAGQSKAVTTFGQIRPNDPQSPVGNYLDAVLVDAGDNVSRAYYPEEFDNNPAEWLPPACWSDNGVGPSVNCSEPQAATCRPGQGPGECRWAVWGSRISNMGSEVPACSQLLKLAWVVPGLGFPMPFLLRMKGSSWKNWKAYVTRVQGQQIGGRKLDPTDVITRMFFVGTGILDFVWAGIVDPQTAEWQRQLWSTNATDSMVGRLDQPRQVALPAPMTTAQGYEQLMHNPAPPAAVTYHPPAPGPQSFGAAPTSHHAGHVPSLQGQAGFGGVPQGQAGFGGVPQGQQSFGAPPTPQPPPPQNPGFGQQGAAPQPAQQQLGFGQGQAPQPQQPAQQQARKRRGRRSNADIAAAAAAQGAPAPAAQQQAPNPPPPNQPAFNPNPPPATGAPAGQGFGGMPDMPATLIRPEAAGAVAASQQPGGGTQPAFGMAAGQQPGADLMRALQAQMGNPPG
ncbi:MAG: hypothetical protein C5B50_00875 [Verrucomicrobia bacterium]|nr:MAG: hypothetical protein C5B50_00875 [Verrucomicrobiota bacterium]